MELRHLRYFVAVAEELNFRRAAERLRVAQPALSSQIKDLERDVGARLLDRDTSGVRVTDAGAAFLAEAREILAHAERAVVVARGAARGVRGKLVVGYFAPIFMGLMPGSLKAFREKFPDVQVELVEMPIIDQLAALETGKIHVGFRVAQSSPLPKGLQHVPVAHSPIRVVLGRSHRLARARSISLAELAKETLLCFTAKKGHPSIHAEIIREFFARRGFNPPALQVIDGVEPFRATLESGIGISLVAELGSLSQGQDMVVRPIKETGPDLFLELEAIWPTDQNSQLTANFVDVIRKIMPIRQLKLKVGKSAEKLQKPA